MAEITIDTLRKIFTKYPTEEGEPEDPAYFDLPHRWNGGDYYRELYVLLNEYRKNVQKYDPDALEDVDRVCNWIRQAVRESFQGNPSKAYGAIKSALDYLSEKHPCFVGEEELNAAPLFRAVDVGDKAAHDRKRVFHVPFNLRSKMSTTRYSIPGYPSLYLGTSLELNCMEIGKDPKDPTVMTAKFEYTKDSLDLFYIGMGRFKKHTVLILDLSVKPQDFRAGSESQRLRILKEEKQLLLESPKTYLFWYPLIAACSFIRVAREDPFSPEYIVPQLVMQWVKRIKGEGDPEDENSVAVFHWKSSVLGGVRYFSCVSNRASELGIDYAFPSSGIGMWVIRDMPDHCPVLAANFELTQPVFTSEYDTAAKCEKALKNTEKYPLARVSDFQRLEKFDIPEGEPYIPAYAFAGCASSGPLNIPDSVTSIERYAFLLCHRLTKITIPAGITSIGHGAFMDCEQVESINVESGNAEYESRDNCVIERETGTLVFGCKNSAIPQDGSVKNIGNNAFHGCSGLKKIVIPSSVTSIGDSAFSDCVALPEIAIPDGVTSIGEEAFCNCGALPEIAISDSVTSIGSSAFARCSALTSVKLPAALTSIGDSAFRGCIVLTEITIPDGVTSIGVFAFAGCGALTSVKLPAKLTSIGNSTFSSCGALSKIVIPDSVTSIGNSAFWECGALARVKLPAKLTSIDVLAFTRCGALTAIELPASVKSVGYMAFEGCTSLRTIIYHNPDMKIGKNAFAGCPGAPKYVPVSPAPETK